MSLTTAIITIVGLDLGVLAALAFVMRAPFRMAEPGVVTQPVEQPHTARPRRRYAASHGRPQPAATTAR